MHSYLALEPVTDLPDPPYPYKYPGIPIMGCYKEVLPDSYWDNWSFNGYSNRENNWIVWDKLEEEARRVGYPDEGKLGKVKEILVHGASLGCEGTGRLPTFMDNSPSVALNGSKVADTLNDWVASGIVAGPLRSCQMPFAEFKVSPMAVAPKPGGKIRIIVDMSSPHDIPKDSPLPNSVNMGIDPTKLSTRMSSLQQVCERIYTVGYPCEMVKADYNSAYKHIWVRSQDHPLQVVHFCGRYFIETQLTFGSRSSPDRFDLVSDLPLDLALMESGVRRDSTIKQLDDVVGFGRLGTGSVGRFYECFRSVCKKVGVSLADEADREKAFGPSRAGVVLGINFDLVRMTWSMPEKKANRTLALLWRVLRGRGGSRKELESLIGKITHYMVLVPFGKWERSWLLESINSPRSDASKFISLEGIALEQLRWWIGSIHLARVGDKIPDPRRFVPRVYLAMFPDAAGGSEDRRAGCGSWFQTSEQNPWIYMAWPKLVQTNMAGSAGVTFGKKLTTLEGFAALVGLVSEPDLVRNKRLIIFTDNAGLFFAYASGHSRCKFAHTICKALHYVGRALNVDIWVEKTPRRSGVGEVVADELSKGNVEVARGLMGDPCLSMSRMSTVLANWIQDPFESRLLGEMIMDELSEFTSVLDWGQF